MQQLMGWNPRSLSQQSHCQNHAMGQVVRGDSYSLCQGVCNYQCCFLFNFILLMYINITGAEYKSQNNISFNALGDPASSNLTLPRAARNPPLSLTRYNIQYAGIDRQQHCNSLSSVLRPSVCRLIFIPFLRERQLTVFNDRRG